MLADTDRILDANFRREHYVSNKQLFQEYVEWYANIESAKEERIEEPQIPAFIVDAMIKIANRLAYRPNFSGYTFRDDMISDGLYDCIRFAKVFNPNKILYKIKLSDIVGKFSIKDVLLGETSKYSGIIKYCNSVSNNLTLDMNESKDFFLDETVRCGENYAIVSQIDTHTADNPFSFFTTVIFNAFLRRIEKEKKQTLIKAKIVTDSDIADTFLLNEGEDAEHKNLYLEFLRECNVNFENKLE